jgi:hypothetical protein
MLALWATLIDKYNSLFFKSTDSNLTSFWYFINRVRKIQFFLN